MNSLRRVRGTLPSFTMRRSLGPSLLYLDDVMHIYDMLVKLSEESTEDPRESVTISSDDIMIEKIEDLERMDRKELSKLSIELSDPFVRVSLRRDMAYVLTHSRSSKPRVLVSSVKAYVDARRSSRALSRSFRFMVCAYVFFPLVLLLYLLVLHEVDWQFWVLVIATVTLPLSAPSFMSTVKVMPAWQRNSVRPRRRSWIDKPDSGEMTDNDFKFMHALMTRISAGDLSGSQVSEIERVLKTLKAKPETE